MGDHCFYCGRHATQLCDGKTETGTCDRPMCTGCVAKSSTYIACIRGKGRRTSQIDTIDYCRDCADKLNGGSLVNRIGH